MNIEQARMKYNEARQQAGLLRAWSAKPAAGIRELMADLAAAEAEERAALQKLQQAMQAARNDSRQIDG